MSTNIERLIGPESAPLAVENLHRLDGKIAIVTGAGSRGPGLGKSAVVTRFLQELAEDRDAKTEEPRPANDKASSRALGAGWRGRCRCSCRGRHNAQLWIGLQHGNGDGECVSFPGDLDRACP